MRLFNRCVSLCTLLTLLSLPGESSKAMQATASAARTGQKSKGIWISPDAIKQLPMTGAAWENVRNAAEKSTASPDLSDQNDPTNVYVLAKALVYVRTGATRYRQEVIDACMAAIGTEKGGRTLALGRELIAYVIAADLVELPPAEDQRFRAYLRQVITEELDGRTLVSTHEDRPNNWGTHAGASRVAVAAYLGDQAELERAAAVFKGWLGDRSSYAGFAYGDLDWQANPQKPVGINAQGATKNGHSIDGVLPDDQRRSGGFKWPPPKENYVYEALQGALAQAVILSRAGYDVWNWQDRALLRAFTWLHQQANFPAEGDDTWEPHLVNFYYGTSFPAPVPAQPGKNIGWTDWTHGSRNGEPPKAGTLRGLVLQADTGIGLQGVRIQLRQGQSLMAETRSDAGGQFALFGLPAGQYELLASKDGYAPQHMSITISAGAVTDISLRLAPLTDPGPADRTPPAPPVSVRIVENL